MLAADGSILVMPVIDHTEPNLMLVFMACFFALWAIAYAYYLFRR